MEKDIPKLTHTTQLQKDHRAHLRSHRLSLELNFGEPLLPSFGFYSPDALFCYSAIIAMTKSGAKGKRPAGRAEELNIQYKGKRGKRNDGATPLPSPTTNAPQNAEPLPPSLPPPPPPPPPFPLTDVVIQARHELLSKTKELYAKMDPLKPRPIHLRETIGIGPEGLALDDHEYWASFPPHVRKSVVRWYSSPPGPAQDGLVMKANEMYALAQRLGVEVEFSEEDGDIPPNSGLPFDPSSVLDDFAFNQYIKDAAATLVPLPDVDFPVNLGGHEGDEEELYSEDVSDEFEIVHEGDINSKKQRRAVVAPEKLTNTVMPARPERSPELQPTPLCADRRRDKSSLPPSLSSTTTTIGSMPVPKSQQQAPPSSVSMGKKPMLYPPTSQSTAATTQQQQTQGKSARAASKQPLPAHAYPHNHPHHHPSPPSSNASQPQKPRPPNASNTSSKNSKIWSTSNSEERERIKEFWLGLGEEERRSLVKIEKDTVLRKMKEQQKHSCNCAVCGRKRFVFLLIICYPIFT